MFIRHLLRWPISLGGRRIFPGVCYKNHAGHFFVWGVQTQPNWETSQTWTENIAAYLLGCIVCFCWYLFYSLLTLTTMMTNYHLSTCICSCRSERVPDVPNNPWPKSLSGLQSTWWPTCECIEDTRPTGFKPVFWSQKKEIRSTSSQLISLATLTPNTII